MPLGCQRCTWSWRRALFETAVTLDCAAVAFGHHADDRAQTTLLNVLFHGRVETMAPVRSYLSDRIRFIRPLCYVPEVELARIARADRLSPPPPPCPRSDHSQRELARGMLRATGQHYRQVRANLIRAGLAYGEPASDGD